MAEDCCTTNGNIMILSCSGGSNVGQLANQAAVELTQEGFGKMFCLAGVGGHLGGFVQSAKDVPEMVAIDGCEIGCAKAILEHAEVPLQSYLVITDLGIEKNKDFDLERPDIKRVKKAVREAAANGNARSEQSRNPVQVCSCCG
ncbi:MAG: putative zinc-binding protein [Deltaproteobacteria bacterium]|nr:putative zinc-binding protein [Deltaproteobacteria bacterium]